LPSAVASWRRCASRAIPFPTISAAAPRPAQLQRDYEQQDKASWSRSPGEFAVAGRLIRNRGAFLLIQDGDGQIQLYIDRKGLSAETLEAIKSWDLGDIVAPAVRCSARARAICTSTWPRRGC
jgi:lysyl-tRNA synthetase class II